MQRYGQLVHLLFDFADGAFLSKVPLEKLSLRWLEPERVCLIARHLSMMEILDYICRSDGVFSLCCAEPTERTLGRPLYMSDSDQHKTLGKRLWDIIDASYL